MNSTGPPEGQQHSADGRRYTCPMDQFALKYDPHHKPLSEEQVIQMVLAGRDRGHLEEAYAAHVAQSNKYIADIESRPTFANKPEDGSPGVRYFTIPESDSHLAIRLWDGNLQQFRLYCFDLFDMDKRVAINLPEGYKICNASYVGAHALGSRGTEVRCWERAWGVPREKLLPGQEHFSAPEDAHLALIRPGKDPFYFLLPARPYLHNGVEVVFHQPVRTLD